MAQPPDLMTRFSRQQCAERINEATGSGWNPFGGSAVIGKAGKGGGALAWNRRFVRNSFRPVLRLRFKAVEGGTLVRCRIGLGAFTLGFSILWCGLALLTARYATLPYLLALLQGRPVSDDVFTAWFPVIMLGFFAIMALGGRMLAGGDDELLLNFVRKRLEAGGGALNLSDI
jgi:hypothetical protein